MSTFRAYTAQCTCGHSFRVQMAVAVNPVRMPHLREDILEGRLHRFTCPECGRTFTAEKRFVYADLKQGLVVHVHPPGHAPQWRQASQALNADLDSLDPHGVVKPKMRRRVAFGIGELREKLVAEDAGLDDRRIELAKVLALHEHPILLRRPRMRLFLDKAHDDRLQFFAGYEHAPQAFGVAVPRFAFDRLSGPVAQKWVADAHKTDLFRDENDLWVSVRRWAPSNTALATLHQLGEAVRAGQKIDLSSPAFKQMVQGLPRGSQLPTAAKIDLRDIEKYAMKDGHPEVQDALFEVRFGVELDDEWGKGQDTSGIDTLWDLLKDLPDTNVEGNSHIHEIFLKPGDGGGVFNPGSDDVTVTSDPAGEAFRTVMRHEIGHAVQEKLDKERKNLVIGYLGTKFGWKTYPGTSAGAAAWVADMAGWGNAGKDDRRRIADALVSSLGPGSSWSPPPPVSLPQGSAWWGDNFGPRLAVAGSRANWYQTNQIWYRQGGKAFFLNYWYRVFMAVDVAWLDFVNQKMPWNYAAMSPAEFFAEIYALYYDPVDPRRTAIPADIAAWLSANVGAPRTGAPAAPPPTPPA